MTQPLFPPCPAEVARAAALPSVALSLRQPWATVVALGWKPLENRRWRTSFRGPFFIHAAKGCTRHEYEEAIAWMESNHLLRNRHIAPLAELPRGGIVGRGRLVDVIDRCAPRAPAPQTEKRFHVAPSACAQPGHEWHDPYQFAFRIADAEELPFVRCAGALGFFKVPAAVLAQLGGAS